MKMLLFFLVSFIVISCTQNPNSSSLSKEKINLLLDKEVAVYHLYSESVQRSLPWNNTFRIRPFITSLFNQVIQNKLTLYNPIFEDTVFNTLEKDVWLNILKNDKNLTFDTTQFNELFFFEYWYLDTTDGFNFEKKLISWAPVKRENKGLKLLGKIKCSPLTLENKKVLATQLIYEFPLYDTLFLNERLNKKKLIKILLDWSLHHPEKTYNPFTAKSMSKKELMQRISLNDSSFYFPYNDIKSLLFIENWYYDTINFSIEKEISSIAPVLYSYDNDEISKHILFVLHLKQKPLKLL